MKIIKLVERDTKYLFDASFSYSSIYWFDGDEKAHLSSEDGGEIMLTALFVVFPTRRGVDCCPIIGIL